MWVCVDGVVCGLLAGDRCVCTLVRWRFVSWCCQRRGVGGIPLQCTLAWCDVQARLMFAAMVTVMLLALQFLPGAECVLE